MSKIKAFTLIELSLVLILISLTMGIGIYAFQVVQQQVIHFIKERRAMLDEVELRYFLQEDMNRCSSVWLRDSLFIFDRHPDTVYYEIGAAQIVRRAGGSAFTYGCSVEQFELAPAPGSGGLQKGKIVCRFAKLSPSRISFQKIYSAEEMLSDEIPGNR